MDGQAVRLAKSRAEETWAAGAGVGLPREDAGLDGGRALGLLLAGMGL
jgi:hypothetical protein